MISANVRCSLCSLALVAAQSFSLAHASCNTRSGFISEQPAAPSARSPSELNAEDEKNFQFAEGQSRDRETITIDLSKDIDSLIGLTGRLTQNADILGIRLENLPGFDKTKHCNQIALVVIKPRVERLKDGTLLASVDHSVPGGRFQIRAKSGISAWKQDSDPSGQFYWIFPKAFGIDRKTRLPWALTSSYEQAFQKAKVGSPERRWTAEAYLNLVLRVYLGRELQGGYPTGNRPNRGDLRKTFFEKSQVDCATHAADTRCITMAVIEANEVGSPGEQISADAFRVSDAVYENSGISAGIRQLDFGRKNDQALKLAPKLFPNTFGKQQLGYGFRRPIRLWEVATLAKWYSTIGKQANEELSKDSAKTLLLDSHVDFILEATNRWTKLVERTYPNWVPADRALLVTLATDLENVTGYPLYLDRNRSGICEVLTDATIINKRSNRSLANSQYKRVTNAVNIASKTFNGTITDLSCAESLKVSAAESRAKTR